MDARELVQKVTGKTIEVLRRCGWVRGTMKDDSGRFCLVGAMQQAIGELHTVLGHDNNPEEAWTRSYIAVQRTLRDRGWSTDRGIEAWNDQSARDVDEVIEVLKLAGDQPIPEPPQRLNA